MYQNNKIILTICARGGSKGIPKKNLRPLLGRPLIGHTLEQAKRLPWVDRIAVSTDDNAIKRLVESFGIPVPFMRPKRLALDTSSKFPVIKHAIQKTAAFWKESYDVSIDLDATSPFRTLEDIENALKLLISTPKTKAVFSVYCAPRSPYFNLVEPDANGYVKISKRLPHLPKRRQDSPVVYAMNASIYVMWIKHLLKESSYHTDQTRVYVMPEERSIDLDRPLDWVIAECLLRQQSKY